MSAEVFTQADGRALWRWSSSHDNAWACAAYDHGPLCRRCVRVDDTMDALLQNVVDGLMTCRDKQDGLDLEFKLTEEGFRRAGHLIDTVVGGDVIDAVREALDDDARDGAAT